MSPSSSPQRGVFDLLPSSVKRTPPALCSISRPLHFYAYAGVVRPNQASDGGGTGTLDWKNIFATAGTGGIKNYFVEMDLEKMGASVPYLRQLSV
jgi:hypothetical protein